MCAISIRDRDLGTMTPAPNTTCDHCGTPIHRYPSRLRRNKGKYCSRSCSSRANPTINPETGRGYMYRPLRERFMEKFEEDRDTGCWVWTGATNEAGYGAIWKDGDERAAPAHRVAYEIFVGPIPEGLFVCHHCDNPPCVNPEHLFVGDAKDNADDMMAKGRGPDTVPPVLRGEDAHTSKLTEAEVMEIRASDEGLDVLAERYGVGAAQVCAVRTGRSWEHLPGARTIRPKVDKLNDQAVIVIRHLARRGRRLQDLADAYGIHYQTAYRVAAGLRWPHVDYPTTRDPSPEVHA